MCCFCQQTEISFTQSTKTNVKNKNKKSDLFLVLCACSRNYVFGALLWHRQIQPTHWICMAVCISGDNSTCMEHFLKQHLDMDWVSARINRFTHQLGAAQPTCPDTASSDDDELHVGSSLLLDFYAFVLLLILVSLSVPSFTATLGTLDFSLLYDQENNALHCTINKAKVSDPTRDSDCHLWLSVIEM